MEPWILPRPINRLQLISETYQKPKRHYITIISLLLDWFEVVQPGDRFMVVNDETLEEFAEGIVLFLKKCTFGRLLPQDLEASAIGLRLQATGVADPYSLSSVKKAYEEMYQRQINLDDPVLIIGAKDLHLK